MSPSCAVQIHYNGDDGFSFIFVACMTPCRVGPHIHRVVLWNEQSVRLYWCVLEFEPMLYNCSMRYEVVMLPSCAVQIHYNVDGGCAFIFVECIQLMLCFNLTNSMYVSISTLCLNLKMLLVFDAV